MRNEAVVKDTSALVGRELPKEAVLAPKGQVNATIKWEVNEPNNIGTAYFLDEGETMRVPEGKAYYIKGRDSWYGAQFFEPGTMIGPVVYAEGESRKPTEVYKSLGGDSGIFFLYLDGVLSLH